MLEAQFFGILFERMKNIELLIPEINRAADAVIEAVTHGGRFIVYDENGMMNGESSYRCSGLRLPYSGNDQNGGLIDVNAGDVVIVYSLLPASEKSLKAVEKARNAGSYLIAVCPRTRCEIRPSGPNLADSVDIFIDDLSDADGMLRPKGWKHSIAPTSAIMNDVILWCLHGQIIDRMTAHGMTPGVLRGGHLKGGAAYNTSVVDSLFKARGW
jgi:uncharacterized phosphosugar-binding protein